MKWLNCRLPAIAAMVCWGWPADAAEIVLNETRMDVVVHAVFDRNSVPLSGEVTLVLTVEGPARVEVAPPRPLLSKASAQLWRVRELGAPRIEALKEGRQRWLQQFQLSPFDVNPSVVIELAPLKVRAGNHAEMTVTWSERASIEVTLSIGNDRTLHPITDIEKLPPAPPQFTPRPRPMMLVGLVIALVFIVGAFLLIVLRRKKPEEPPLTGAARALSDLSLLRQSGLASEVVHARVADIIRLYLHEKLQIPAVHLTTGEVLAAIQKDHPQLQAIRAPLQELLERCDVAKFAGAAAFVDANDCISHAVSIVESTATIAQAPVVE